jgi:hypothetical protein
MNWPIIKRKFNSVAKKQDLLVDAGTGNSNIVVFMIV